MTRRPTMIGTARISKILRTVVASEHVSKDGRGLSCALIAPSDAGKSAMVLAHLPKDARVLDDFTTASLQSVLTEKNPPRWIVVPDLNQAVSHRANVATLTMAFLLSLMGEGVTEIPGLEGSTKMIADQFRERGQTISLITAITPDMFFKNSGKWRSTGLLRRLVPIYYAYTEETQKLIQDSIEDGSDAIAYPHIRLEFGKQAPRVPAIPAKLATEVRIHSEKVTIDHLKWNKAGRDVRAVEYPFSAHKVLKTYVRARAWLNGHRVVTKQDVAEMKDFAEFMRYDRPESV